MLPGFHHRSVGFHRCLKLPVRRCLRPRLALPVGRACLPSPVGGACGGVRGRSKVRPRWFACMPVGCAPIGRRGVRKRPPKTNPTHHPERSKERRRQGAGRGACVVANAPMQAVPCGFAPGGLSYRSLHVGCKSTRHGLLASA